MILRQAPAVNTIVGMDSSRGWLPAGAAQPLIESPVNALLDVRIFEADGRTSLCWRPHESALSQLPSATGVESCDSRRTALDRSEQLFGLADEDWTFRGDGAPPTVDDVATLRDRALVAHHVDLALALDGLVIARPTLVTFEVPNGKPLDLWLVLGAPGDEYVVFYDPANGGYGLAAASDPHRPLYLGDYGSLWETIEGM